MITSVIPKERRRESVISRSVRPLISTRALGRVSVSGRRRVPRPAARIMAFIGGEAPEGKEVGSGERRAAEGKRLRRDSEIAEGTQRAKQRSPTGSGQTPGGPYKSKIEERFLSAQADPFAGAKGEEEV